MRLTDSDLRTLAQWYNRLEMDDLDSEEGEKDDKLYRKIIKEIIKRQEKTGVNA